MPIGNMCINLLNMPIVFEHLFDVFPCVFSNEKEKTLLLETNLGDMWQNNSSAHIKKKKTIVQ